MPNAGGTVTPFLWFDGKAAEAAAFYVSLFPNSRITSEGGMSVRFELDGREYVAFNGGPEYNFTPAISLYVSCSTQAEVDRLWTALTDGGESGSCGWLTDRYGLSWQIIPDVLVDLLNDDDDEKSERAMQAMFQMSKIDIATLEKAAAG